MKKIKNFDKYVKDNDMIVRTFGSVRIAGEKYYWELFDQTYSEYEKLTPELSEIEIDYDHFILIHNTLREAVGLEKFKVLQESR